MSDRLVVMQRVIQRARYAPSLVLARPSWPRSCLRCRWTADTVPSRCLSSRTRSKTPAVDLSKFPHIRARLDQLQQRGLRHDPLSDRSGHWLHYLQLRWAFKLVKVNDKTSPVKVLDRILATHRVDPVAVQNYGPYGLYQIGSTLDRKRRRNTNPAILATTCEVLLRHPALVIVLDMMIAALPLPATETSLLVSNPLSGLARIIGCYALYGTDEQRPEIPRTVREKIATFTELFLHRYNDFVPRLNPQTGQPSALTQALFQWRYFENLLKTLILLQHHADIVQFSARQLELVESSYQLLVQHLQSIVVAQPALPDVEEDSLNLLFWTMHNAHTRSPSTMPAAPFTPKQIREARVAPLPADEALAESAPAIKILHMHHHLDLQNPRAPLMAHEWSKCLYDLSQSLRAIPFSGHAVTARRVFEHPAMVTALTAVNQAMKRNDTAFFIASVNVGLVARWVRALTSATNTIAVEPLPAHVTDAVNEFTELYLKYWHHVNPTEFVTISPDDQRPPKNRSMNTWMHFVDQFESIESLYGNADVLRLTPQQRERLASYYQQLTNTLYSLLDRDSHLSGMSSTQLTTLNRTLAAAHRKSALPLGPSRHIQQLVRLRRNQLSFADTPAQSRELSAVEIDVMHTPPMELLEQRHREAADKLVPVEWPKFFSSLGDAFREWSAALPPSIRDPARGSIEASLARAVLSHPVFSVGLEQIVQSIRDPSHQRVHAWCFVDLTRWLYRLDADPSKDHEAVPVDRLHSYVETFVGWYNEETINHMRSGHQNNVNWLVLQHLTVMRGISNCQQLPSSNIQLTSQQVAAVRECYQTILANLTQLVTADPAMRLVRMDVIETLERLIIRTNAELRVDASVMPIIASEVKKARRLDNSDHEQLPGAKLM